MAQTEASEPPLVLLPADAYKAIAIIRKMKQINKNESLIVNRSFGRAM
jgi:hypothetical protein